jgi:hypothetical protein
MRFANSTPSSENVDDIGDDEWKVIETRAARRDLASDEEVEEVFSRYRKP